MCSLTDISVKDVFEMQKKYCMLEDDKLCDDCCECNICDLDKKKLCDNCAKCIDTDADCKTIKIDDIILDTDLKKKLRFVDSRRNIRP